MISINTARSILKKAGAKRISKDAAVALKEILEKKGEEIAKEAAKNAFHAGRIVVKAIDIVKKERQEASA